MGFIKYRTLWAAVLFAFALCGCGGLDPKTEDDPYIRAKEGTTHFTAAGELYKRGELARAIEELHGCIDWIPDHRQAHLMLSWALYYKAREVDKDSYLDKGHSLGLEWDTSARKWNPTGKFSKEETEAYNKEFEKKQNDARNMYEEALRVAQRALALRAGTDAYQAIGYINAMLGRLKEADEAFLEIENDSTVSREAVVRIRELRQELEKLQKAQNSMNKNKELPDEFPDLTPPK